MQSFRSLVVLAVIASLAIGLAQSAPTETDASTTPMTPQAPKDAKTDAPTSTTPQDSMAVSSAQDQTRVNTSFSCYRRQIGYYADVATGCQVYHFCSPGDFNGEIAYQRISYLCLNETKFDQQVLDCVADDKMTAPCAESTKHYEESNKILRQAVIGSSSSNTESKAVTSETVSSTTSTTSAPEVSSSTEAASTEASTTMTTTTSATSSEKANDISA